MLGDFQRHLQFLGFRPESDVEYLSQPLPYLSSEGAFDGESLNGQPMVFRAGSATELGEFRRDKDRLVVELAQIEGGVLVSLGSLLRRYARLQGIESVEWIVHAVTCAKPNLKLRRVLDRRGFTVRDLPGSAKPTTIWILTWAIDYVARLADIHAMIVSDNRQRHITACATEEIKLDGYRIEVVRTGGRTTLYSRRQNVLNHKFHYIAKALDYLPADTVLDGELVAMGPDGKPNFNLLQNFKSAESHITYYAFDVLMQKGRDLTQVPLSERRALLRTMLKPSDHVALSEVSDRTAAEMLKFVKSHGLEGVVAKRGDSVYQPGLRTGLWTKHRINLGQEFVIGGYTPGTHGFDALIVGFYRGRELIYAARVRAGLVPATRRAVFEKLSATSPAVPIVGLMYRGNVNPLGCRLRAYPPVAGLVQAEGLEKEAV